MLLRKLTGSGKKRTSSKRREEKEEQKNIVRMNSKNE